MAVLPTPCPDCSHKPAQPFPNRLALDDPVSTACLGPIKDIIANNPIDQKVVELSSSQPYALVEHSRYRSVFPPQGVEDGVLLPASPSASKAFAGHDESDACGISAMACTFSVCLGAVCATTLC